MKYVCTFVCNKNVSVHLRLVEVQVHIYIYIRCINVLYHTYYIMITAVTCSLNDKLHSLGEL